MEQTKQPHIFVAGDILHGAPHNEPTAAISGKRIADFIHANLTNNTKQLKKLKNFVFDLVPYCLFSSPEISGGGLTDFQAVSRPDSSNLMSITLKKSSFHEKLLQVHELQKYRKFNIVKILYENESKKVVGLHFLGEDASEIIQGFSVRERFNWG